MKRLEEYIKNNRAGLDVDQPDDDRIWAEVRHQTGKRRDPWFSVLKIAATLLILFGSIYLFYNKVLFEAQPDKTTETVSLGDLSAELAEKESFYLMAISKKWAEIEKYEISHDDMKVLYDELDYLDKLDDEYIEDMKELGPHEKIIRSMLNNYDKRIRILEKILSEIEKEQKHENLRIQVSI